MTEIVSDGALNSTHSVTVIVTHESYDSVMVGTEKQKGLESLSESRE